MQSTATVGVAGRGQRGHATSPNFQKIQSFCALRGIFPRNIVLFAYNQTFWSPPNFLKPHNFWAGYDTDEEGIKINVNKCGLFLKFSSLEKSVFSPVTIRLNFS